MTRIDRALRDLLTGEAQRQPYPWSATAMGHCWLGMGIWGGLAVILDRWTAVWLAPLVYFAVVEGVQLALAPRRDRALIWDAILDTVAVTLGCVAGACLGDGNLNGAMGAWSGSVGVVAAGWWVRDR